MFSVGQTCLECVDQYKYLGVNMAANGKLLVAEKMLSLKACRAFIFNKAKYF